jgi:hypothetical protein
MVAPALPRSMSRTICSLLNSCGTVAVFFVAAGLAAAFSLVAFFGAWRQAWP